MATIFISYSRRDDKDFGPRNEHWVSTFQKALTETLDQRVKAGQVQIWRDINEIDETTTFDDAIDSGLDRADFLITVLSQHYLASAYCRKELRRFGEPRLLRNDLRVGRHSRIVKVYRAAVDRKALRSFATPPDPLALEIDATEGFAVYCVDGDDYRDVLLHPDGLRLVWQKADDLARVIKRIIDERAQAVPQAASGPVVYLARCAADLREAHDALRRELEDQHCTVLPEGELPEEADAFAAAVRRDLDQAQFSVHLVGLRLGVIPDGGQVSVVESQIDLALAVQRPGFFTLAWSPQPRQPSGVAGTAPTPAAAGKAEPGPGADTLPAESQMRALRDSLVQRALPRERFEYLRSDASALHASVRQLLLPKPSPQLTSAQPAGPGRSVYLVCDKPDRAQAQALRDALKPLGFKRITLPPAEGSSRELDEDHKRCLVESDAVVVLWGAVREPWVRKKLADVEQAAGLGRRQPLRGCILLKLAPDTEAKHSFDAAEGVTVLAAAELQQTLQRMLN